MSSMASKSQSEQHFLALHLQDAPGHEHQLPGDDEVDLGVLHLAQVEIGERDQVNIPWVIVVAQHQVEDHLQRLFHRVPRHHLIALIVGLSER
jgi:hypothetical protein